MSRLVEALFAVRNTAYTGALGAGIAPHGASPAAAVQNVPVVERGNTRNECNLAGEFSRSGFLLGIGHEQAAKLPTG